jgi:hypothetical protein
MDSLVEMMESELMGYLSEMLCTSRILRAFTITSYILQTSFSIFSSISLGLNEGIWRKWIDWA